MTTPAEPGLSPFVRQAVVLLTTYKRDGTGVGTPVNIAVDRDHAYVRTYSSSGKAKRLRNFPEVEFCAATWRGRPTGPARPARLRLIDPASREYRRAERALTRKYPLLHGLVVPLTHRLKKDRTLHYELRLIENGRDAGPAASRDDTTEVTP